MREIANALRAEVDHRAGQFRALSDAHIAADRGTGTWTRKDILGHLIDSAANNHQRFVRAQFVNSFMWPGYDQDAWVALHSYRDRSWPELVELWVALNLHIAHVIDGLPTAQLQVACRIGDGDPVTLEWLVRDYLRHLKHHAGQILAAPTQA